MQKVATVLFRSVLSVGMVVALLPGAFASTLSASATYTDIQVSPGVYNYNLTLTNTGSTTIGEFWFAWVPGAGFLSATPSSIGSPSGWGSTVTNSGAAIQWIDSSTLLAAGQSLSGFSFDSTETPAQLLADYAGTGTGAGDPVTTSYVYMVTKVGSDPGDKIVATPAAVTPEPGTLLLTITGFGVAIGSLRRRFGRVG